MSSSTSLPIFYFRGLNTRGDDSLHFGPIKAQKDPSKNSTSMFTCLEEEFSKYAVQFIPIKNMGTGSILEVAKRAKKSLQAHPAWKKSNNICFLGHSTGALIARVLVHDPNIQSKVKKIISFAAPNQGTNAADRALLIPKLNPKTYKLAQFLGVDINRRLDPIQYLTLDSINNFNKEFPPILSIQYSCILCHRKYSEQGPLMKLMAQIAHRSATDNKWLNEDSDGLIFKKHQIYGEVLGQFQLDHISEIGYFPLMSKNLKLSHKSEFQRMIQRIIKEALNL